MIKVRLQLGHASIELEGDVKEVEKVLAEYWLPTIAVEPYSPDLQPGPEINNGQLKEKLGKAKPKGRAKRPAQASGSDGSTKSSPRSGEDIANAVKLRPEFERIKSKVLDVPGDWINKCRLVAMVSGDAITSGDVQRTLETLRIKSALSTLSTTLSQNSSEFLTKGSNPVKYEMTAAAQENFERWLDASNAN